MRLPHLRVTQRCLEEDLELDPGLAERDARDYCAQHDALRAFVLKREGAPGVGEPTRGIKPFGAWLNLHHGRTRAVTYWDEEEDVCWLVAYSRTHASGEDRDCYNYFVDLGSKGRLGPTTEDYEKLNDRSVLQILDDLAAFGADLFTEARANPGVELNETVSGAGVSLVIDLVVIEEDNMEEGWISLQFPPDTNMDENDALSLFSRLLPPEVFKIIDWASSFHDRPLRPDELVFTWDRGL